MLNKITAIAGLVAVAALFPCSSALANDVNDAIREANGVASEAENYVNKVMTPQIVRQQQYMNQLQSACYQGNTAACRQSTQLLRRQTQRYNRVILWQKSRLNR